MSSFIFCASFKTRRPVTLQKQLLGAGSAPRAVCSQQLMCSWRHREDEVAGLVCLPLWRWHSSRLSPAPRGRRKWMVASLPVFLLTSVDLVRLVASLFITWRFPASTLSCLYPLTLASASLPFLFSASCVSLLKSCLIALLKGFRTRPRKAYFSKYMFFYNHWEIWKCSQRYTL